MSPAPHDLVDLRLAPVALAVDQVLEEFAGLSPVALHERVVLESNSQATTRRRREQDVVTSVTHGLDTRGWEASWDPRGLRLRHDEHTIVLGAPANLRRYVDELEG